MRQLRPIWRTEIARLSLTGVLFLLAFAAACVMALARHPIFGLLAYVGAFYLHPPSRWWGQGFLLPIRWSLIAAAITLIAILIHQKKLPKAKPILGHGFAIAFLLFTSWLGVQSFWALDPAAHSELFSYYIKFGLAMYLFYRAIDTEQHMRWLMWAHVLGCFYFGWIAFTSYEGGRFEDFGGPGLAEANAGALTIVTGILIASALFLASDKRLKAALFIIIPVIVNGLVTTISRSGFLAAAVGGLILNLFSPTPYRKLIRVLSILAAVMFLLLTGPSYWERINSIKQLGNEVEGVDTGAGRLVIMQAQLEMFARYPLGCGATCTAVLSPLYLPAEHLDGGARASHNTFFTMMVEHGVPGVVFYAVMALWVARSALRLRSLLREGAGFLSVTMPALVGSLGAIFVCDMFATYAKFEVRIWFLAMMMAMLNLAAATRAPATDAIPSRAVESDRKRARRLEAYAARGRKGI
jgi:hypothetical protein